MNPDPFEEGRRAAGKLIPAAANPYEDGTDDHARWAEGHEQVASALEAGESEG
jgi:hypothetical protein